MKNYSHILSLDPSGNWAEGKGTTGICLLAVDTDKIDLYDISATKFDQPEAYWHEHIMFIDNMAARFDNLVLVIEDYLLYADKAKNQINSRMETPKLIGIIQHHCFINNIPCFIEPASAVKARWTNPILERKGYIKAKGNCYYVDDKRACRHHLDAIRHAVHYKIFINGKKECLYES